MFDKASWVCFCSHSYTVARTGIDAEIRDLMPSRNCQLVGKGCERGDL